MNLAYEAIDATGRQVHDVTEAATAREAVELLRGRGLMVTHIEPAAERGTDRAGRAAARSGAGRFPLQDLVLFTRQMSMLLSSGSAVVPALGAVQRQMKKPAQAEMIRSIRTDVEEGVPLTEALRKFPAAFDPIYCALVAAGEASAKLPAMFARLAEMTVKRRMVLNKVVGAMAYPVLLIGLSVVILGVLLFFVMPRFAIMFDTLEVPLPASTAWMLGLAGNIRDYWYLAVLALAGGIAGIVFLLRSTAGRQWLSDMQIRIPLAGRLASRLILARVMRVLGILIDSHVSILEALDLARGVTINRRYRALLDALEESVTRGKSLSGALERSGLPAPSICQAIQTGEESGNLGGAINFVADVLDEENRELIDSLSRLVEPLILIGMGLVIGTVAISLFLPMFDVTSAIK